MQDHEMPLVRVNGKVYEGTDFLAALTPEQFRKFSRHARIMLECFCGDGAQPRIERREQEEKSCLPAVDG